MLPLRESLLGLLGDDDGLLGDEDEVTDGKRALFALGDWAMGDCLPSEGGDIGPAAGLLWSMSKFVGL